MNIKKKNNTKGRPSKNGNVYISYHGNDKSFINELRTIPTDKLLSTIHYANRLLQRRDLVDNLNEGLVIRGVSGEPQENEAQLAQRLVKWFADREGIQLQQMTDTNVNRYTKYLSRFALRRINRENPIGPERAVKAKELLKFGRELGSE